MSFSINRFVSYFYLNDLFAVFGAIAVIEGRKSGDRAPGDFSFNPLKFGKTEASQKDLATKEVSNGRLAMIAMAGILLQGTTTGLGAFESF